MNYRMSRTPVSVPTLPMRLSILLAAVLMVILGTLPGIAKTALADEPEIDAMNEEALRTLAIKGYSVTKVSLGAFHSAAITSDGSLWTWGENGSGRLGFGTRDRSLVPKKVESLSDVVAVSLGYNHSAALTSDGSLWTWGNNERGQLGDGTTNESLSPKRVEGLSGVTAVSLGMHTSAAITSDGSLWTWGDNRSGQLGTGMLGYSLYSTPQRVSALSGVMAVSLGGGHDAAITSDGSLWMWGDNDRGQLGDGTTADSWTPKRVDGLPEVVAVSLGRSHSAAVTTDGSLWTWGFNGGGQLGDGTKTDSWTPKRVDGLSGITTVSLGYNSAVITSDGSLWTWGYNESGEIGDGTTADRLTPKKVDGLSNVVAVSLGNFHSAAVTSDGSLRTWGGNHYGQLGDGTGEDRYIPIQIFEGSGEITPSKPEATLSLKPDSVNFVYNTTKHAYNYPTREVTLTYKNCKPEPVADDDELVQIKLVSDDPAKGMCVYELRPKGTPAYMKEKGTWITFRAKSTIEGVKDPSPKLLKVTFEEKVDSYLDDVVNQTQATQYNPELAYQLADLANKAYVEKDMCSAYEELGFTIGRKDYEDNNTAAYVIGTKQLDDGSTTVLVTIRGTIDPLNYLDDANCSKTQVFNGWHNGFNESADAIYTEIKNVLGGIRKSSTRYVITGHSMGGAIGNLIAMKLWQDGVPSSVVYDYNYACPDVASQSSSDWNPDGVHNNIFNLGNQYDNVTFLPRYIGVATWYNPWSKWGKFGQTRWFNPVEKVTGSDSWERFLGNHSMELYKEFFAQRKPFDSLMTESQLSSHGGVDYQTYGKWLGIFCPVDVSIYDSSGRRVVTVEGEDVHYEVSDRRGVIVLLNSDDKYIYLPSDVGYRVELTATGSGEMDLKVATGYLGSSGRPESEKVFSSVELHEGKTMRGEIDASSTATTTKLYVTDEGGAPVLEVGEDGTESPYVASVEMYRMYNRWSGEHLYTASAAERDQMRGDGWDYEGVMWRAPKSSGTPVYRLYNPYSFDHHYARTLGEYNTLRGQGWRGEGIAFYSAGTDGVPIYRLFNPNQTGAGTHHYTASASEKDANVRAGWEYEDVGWYGLK